MQPFEQMDCLLNNYNEGMCKRLVLFIPELDFGEPFLRTNCLTTQATR